MLQHLTEVLDYNHSIHSKGFNSYPKSSNTYKPKPAWTTYQNCIKSLPDLCRHLQANPWSYPQTTMDPKMFDNQPSSMPPLYKHPDPAWRGMDYYSTTLSIWPLYYGGFLPAGYSPKELKILNNCRMHLQITTLAEISEHTGHWLLQSIITRGTTMPMLHMISQSKHTWPIQQQLCNSSWKLWDGQSKHIILNSCSHYNWSMHSDLGQQQPT